MENLKENSDRIVSSKELKEELSKIPKQAGYSTGYKNLDAYLGDVREGDLIIISGVTGEGKSQAGVSFTKNFIEQNINCLWFSFEISSQELMERFGVEVPIFYLPRLITSKAVDWINKKILEGVKKYQTKVVFIDHLHYLTDDVSVRNRNLPEILGNLCRQFKLMARQHRLIIFLIAHTRKIKGDRNRPTIEDLKDSSGIAQEADTVLIVQRKGKRRSKKNDDEESFDFSTDVNLWIEKNRRTGRLGVINMKYDMENKIHLEYE